MDKQEFIELVRQFVVESTINGTGSVLTSPPGRSPHKDLVEVSKWFNNLGNVDKENVIKVIRRAVEGSVFSFLCVLDGVRAIESGPDRGILRLLYVKDGKEVVLNDENDGYDLHDLL
ncbi:hypothetical protein CLV51_1135 [Chitinophaga niastensis]|uniref:Uncharacterized protein n=1 Tax=Chitinophaga niastensis TaxID=536980 RepID=A0A2P8H811_CHINA|nr:hypothetical protein [Chitinophaga niastensis]PSL42367.1 hypothetical protein CLV51_1135 [Chitinophaga niastensis]